MPGILAPTFLIHGQKDSLIPYSHSQELHQLCSGLCQLILPKEMDHNQFDPYEDLIYPFIDFLNNCKITTLPDPGNQAFIECPPELLQTPNTVQEVPSKPTNWQKFVKYMIK